MGTLSTALRGLGRGVMALLAGTWAMLCWSARQFHWDTARRGPRPAQPRGWRLGVLGLLSLVYVLAGVLAMSWATKGLPSWQEIPILLVGLFTMSMVAIYWRHIGMWQRITARAPRKFNLPWITVLLVLLAVAILPLMVPATADAHPPSETNKATDTEPHPMAGESVLTTKAVSWLAALTGWGAQEVCQALVVAGLTYFITSGNAPGAVATVAIGGGCFVASTLVEFEVNDLLAAVKYPLTIHRGGHGRQTLDATCMSLLSGPGVTYPSASTLQACGPMAKHIAAHHDFEQGPAKHAAKRASILADAQKKLAAKVAVYKEYTGERLSQRGGATLILMRM